jgi:cystinosin
MTALRSQRVRRLICIAVPSIGALLASTAPSNPQLAEPWSRISSFLGWTYFAAWSVSFYPQIILNYQRKSVIGLSFDFSFCNVLGFLSYSIYNCVFFLSTTVQDMYADAYGGSGTIVDANDVFFAVHALAMTLITAAQCLMYERGNQRVSRGCRVVCTVVVVAASAGAGIKYIWPSAVLWMDWLTFLYLLSFIKMGVTLYKYTPQLYLNHKRKSTEGWSIDVVLLDFTGGLLSTAQMFLDAAASGNWGFVLGNPVKFGLGIISIVYDVAFMLQHYVLYPDADFGGHRYRRLKDGEADERGYEDCSNGDQLGA